MIPEVGEARVDRSGKSAKDIVAAFPDQARNGRSRVQPQVPSGRSRRFLVALLLVICFSGMLLATHKYVTSRWNPLSNIPRVGELLVIGREGITTTDVNLRPNPSASNTAIGMAEYGSRVKVLAVNNNWYEVQVLQHGRPKTDQFSSDRGWINKRFVRFE
jgi:Bacterial SH3 domain